MTTGRYSAQLQEVLDDLDSLKDSVKELSAQNSKLAEKIEQMPSSLRPEIESLLGRHLEKVLHSYHAQRNITRERNGPKRLLIVGFFGAFNLGDEIMLESLLANLTERNNIEITIMLSENYLGNRERYGPHRFINYPTQLSELDLIAIDYDAVFFAGGALIDDVDFSANEAAGILSLPRILIELSSRFIVNDKQCILYGLSSVTEIKDGSYVNKLQYLIDNADHFSLRDTNSLGSLEKAGLTTEKVTIVDDLLLAHPGLLNNNLASSGDEIGLVFVYQETYLPVLKKITNRILAENPNKTLILIPFYSYRNNDKKLIGNLIQSINSPRLTTTETYPKDLGEIQRILSGCTKIYSMRYHATLLAGILGKPTTCLNIEDHPHYYNKNYYLKEHYGLPIEILNFPTGITKLLKNKKKLPSPLKLNMTPGDTAEHKKDARKSLVKVIDRIDVV